MMARSRLDISFIIEGHFLENNIAIQSYLHMRNQWMDSKTSTDEKYLPSGKLSTLVQMEDYSRLGT